jgi:hypothetical protein
MPLTVLPGTGISGTRVAAPTGVMAIDTAVLQAALALAREVLPQEGTYVVSQLTVTADDRYLRIPRGCTIKLADAQNTSLFAVTGKRFAIEGAGVIDGNGANQTGPAASTNTGLITVTGGDGFSLGRDVTVQNSYGHGVILNDTPAPAIRGIVNGSLFGHGIYWRVTNGGSAILGPVIDGARVDRTTTIDFPRWTATTVVALGTVWYPDAAHDNGHAYKATVGGTTAGAAPAWPTGAGATVADGTVTWTEIGNYGWGGIKVNGSPTKVTDGTTGGVSSVTITSAAKGFLQNGVVPPIGSIVRAVGFPVGLAVTGAAGDGSSITVSQAVTLTGGANTVAVVAPVESTRVVNCTVRGVEGMTSAIGIELFNGCHRGTLALNHVYGGGMGYSVDKGYMVEGGHNHATAFNSYGMENAACQLSTCFDHNTLDGASVKNPGTVLGQIGIIIDGTGYGALNCHHDNNTITNVSTGPFRHSGDDSHDNTFDHNTYRTTPGLPAPAGPLIAVSTGTNGLKGCTANDNDFDGGGCTDGIFAKLPDGFTARRNKITNVTNAVNFGTTAGTYNNVKITDNNFAGCTNGVVGLSATVLLGTGCEVARNSPFSRFVPGSAGGHTTKLSEDYAEIQTGNTNRTITLDYAYQGKRITVVKNDTGTGTVGWAASQGSVLTTGGGALGALTGQYAHATVEFNGTNWIAVA